MGKLGRDPLMLMLSFSFLFYVVEVLWIVGQQILSSAQWSMAWYIPIITSLILSPLVGYASDVVGVKAVALVLLLVGAFGVILTAVDPSSFALGASIFYAVYWVILAP